MKTNLVKLVDSNSGVNTYGVFLGSIDTEYDTGTDFRAEIVDFYLTIEGKYVAHDHKGKHITNISERFVSGLRNCDLPRKKRGKHSCSNNKVIKRNKELYADIDDMFSFIFDNFESDF